MAIDLVFHKGPLDGLRTVFGRQQCISAINKHLPEAQRGFVEFTEVMDCGGIRIGVELPALHWNYQGSIHPMADIEASKAKRTDPVIDMIGLLWI